jgi:hypothetical protein
MGIRRGPLGPCFAFFDQQPVASAGTGTNRSSHRTRCYTARTAVASHDAHTRVSWFLPLSLVLLVGIVMGAGHLLFVRWMQRATAPEPIADNASDERGDEAL